MDTFNYNSINQTLDQGFGMINKNKWVSATISLFLALYAALAAPKLPRVVAQLFDYWWFKLLFIVLIAFMATKDPTIAIIASVGLVITLHTLSMLKLEDKIVQAAEAEYAPMQEEGYPEEYQDEEVVNPEELNMGGLARDQEEIAGEESEAGADEEETGGASVQNGCAKPDVRSGVDTHCFGKPSKVTGFTGNEYANY
jgi:hypothetical protein